MRQDSGTNLLEKYSEICLVCGLCKVVNRLFKYKTHGTEDCNVLEVLLIHRNDNLGIGSLPGT